jgi:hypothetical protein
VRCRIPELKQNKLWNHFNDSELFLGIKFTIICNKIVQFS